MHVSMSNLDEQRLRILVFEKTDEKTNLRLSVMSLHLSQAQKVINSIKLIVRNQLKQTTRLHQTNELEIVEDSEDK